MSHPSVHTPETRIDVGRGVEITYETFGNPEHPPLLLVMGLAMQMIAWDTDFCAALAAKGYYVIRFDNRDVGRSSWFDHLGMPNIPELIQKRLARQPIEVPYQLTDMVEDTVGLLDALGIDAAHVVGASMGGMISQLLAIHHPERVRTLTSWMSTTGDPSLPRAQPHVIAAIMMPKPTRPEALVAYALELWKILNGSVFPMDKERVKTRSLLAMERGANPKGVGRQIAAILAAPSRRKPLRKLQVPTLVIHGDNDPLVPVECGIDTAEHIPRAKLHIIPGKGHAFPPVLWPQILEAIAQHAR